MVNPNEINQNKDSDGQDILDPTDNPTSDNNTASPELLVTSCRAQRTPEQEKPARHSTIRHRQDNGMKNQQKTHKMEKDSGDDTTSISSDNTGTTSNTENESDQDEDNNSCSHCVMYHPCRPGCGQDPCSCLSKLVDDTTLINRKVLSQLLKVIDRESKFKNALLARHLDIVENTLLEDPVSESSSEEE